MKTKDSKEFSSRQIAQIKNTAKNVHSHIVTRNKAQEQIEALQKEVEAADAAINAWETPVKMMTGGYTSSDLVERKVVVAQNEDGTIKTRDGKPVKTVTFVLRYPETVIPVETEKEFTNPVVDGAEVDDSNNESDANEAENPTSEETNNEETNDEE